MCIVWLEYCKELSVLDLSNNALDGPGNINTFFIVFTILKGHVRFTVLFNFFLIKDNGEINCGFPKLMNCGFPKLMNCDFLNLINCGFPKLMNCGFPKLINCGFPKLINCGFPKLINCGSPKLINCGFPIIK